MNRIRFVCDATNLMGPWGAETDDIYLVAGFAIREERVGGLIQAIQAQKEDITGHPFVPVKWNMRDVRAGLKHLGLESEEKTLISNSNLLRAALLRELCGTEPVIFASAICAHSNSKSKIVEIRPKLIAFSFQNLIQRLGLWAKAQGSNSVRLTLDWPESSERSPFVSEYLNAWLPEGSSVPQNHCGSLGQIGFEPGLDFGVTHIDPLLQLSDLIVGATKSFLQHSLRQTPPDFGVEQFKCLLPLFYQTGRGPVGYGLTISPSEDSLKNQLRSTIESI